MVPPRDGQTPAQRSAGGLVSRTRRVDGVSLAALFDVVSGPRLAWTAPAEPTVVGGGAAVTVAVDGPDRFSAVRERAAELFATVDRPADAPAAARPRLLGGFAFHDAHEPRPPWDGFPPALFVLPGIQLVRDGDATWLTANGYGPDADPASVADALDETVTALQAAEPSTPGLPGIETTAFKTTLPEWRRQVDAVLDRIRVGDLEKAVLAQALAADLDGPFSLPSVLDRLAESYPGCHRFAVAPDGAPAFFGATPERLVSLSGTRVETGALAGSIGRGETTREDDALAEMLLDSEKNQHEHALVVEAIRDQLEPLADRVTTGSQSIRALPTVQHLNTPIAADLRESMHVLDLVEALHPTPAVGGLPPAAALRTIRDIESFDRGWYAAPVGWFDAAGEGSFAVAIRSAVATERRATLFAGAGIVADSDPDAEWDEVQLKYRPMVDNLDA